MAKVVCSRCMDVFDEEGGRCPRCDAGSPNAYDFSNSDEYLKREVARVHHMAFQTDRIEDAYSALKEDGMNFLIELVVSPDEGLKQTFTQPSKNTLLVNEYIHRYGGFDGFFTKSNVAHLTEATGRR